MTASKKAKGRVRDALMEYDRERLVTASLPPSLAIWLPIATPSLNEVNGWHWAKKHKWTKQIGLLVRLTRARRAEVAWVRERRMQVTITRYGSRELDDDNFRGGCKGLIDALVREGVILDDSPRWVTVTYVQVKCSRKEARTMVSVYADTERSG